MAATWREHLRANPVPRGQQVLFLRHMLAADGGEATTPAHAALILDLKRRYLEMRPRLRRIYSLAADPAAALSQFAPLGFARLPEGAAGIGGVECGQLHHAVAARSALAGDVDERGAGCDCDLQGSDRGVRRQVAGVQRIHRAGEVELAGICPD